ncbi:MAG TPA: 23S rRNA (pseudouridine(1915)-N(3))-methyltransferase RlmH [Coriobacteriia bacterium]|nr:23S rRNA (pseudouridine(1915)-N(3))-methyltransferase RlmH [Coriobacteriia bacterium]
MKIAVIAVGKLKERFWREAAEEYAKRMTPYCDLRLIEIADRDPARGGEERARAEEGVDVLRALPDGARVITLEIGGKERSSEQLAQHIESLAVGGVSSLAFVIGGSTGLSADVLARADERMSLSAMTLPHNLARVVLLEQLYRSFKIRRGEPYHK